VAIWKNKSKETNLCSQKYGLSKMTCSTSPLYGLESNFWQLTATSKRLLNLTCSSAFGIAYWENTLEKRCTWQIWRQHPGVLLTSRAISVSSFLRTTSATKQFATNSSNKLKLSNQMSSFTTQLSVFLQGPSKIHFKLSLTILLNNTRATFSSKTHMRQMYSSAS
jgi:hypothetical protein